MAENAGTEDLAPLLVKDEVDNMNNKSEAVVAVVNSNRRMLGFVYQRSTYYWIAFIAQFSQVVLQTIGFAVTKGRPVVKGEDKTYNRELFLLSGLYSLFTLLLLMGLVLPGSSKFTFKRLNASRQVNLTVYCAFLNTMNLITMVGPTVDSFDKLTDDILPIIIPLLFGFKLVSAAACITAVCITYKAAKRARGNAMVPDPDHRVPAWYLATTEECQDLSSQGAIQLPC